MSEPNSIESAAAATDTSAAGEAAWVYADRDESANEHRPTPRAIPTTELAAAGDVSLADGLLVQAVAVARPATPRRRARGAGARSRRWLLHRLLLLADVVGLTIAFGLAEVLSVGGATHDHVGLDAEGLLFVLTLPAWVVVAKLHGLYDNDDERTDHTTADDLVGVLHLVTLGLCFFVFAGWATGWATPSVPKLFTFSLLALALVPLARGTARAAARRSTLYVQNALIVGAGEVGQLVALKLQKHPEYGIRVVGYVDSDPVEGARSDPDVPVLGDIVDLPELVESHEVERVFVAFSRDTNEEMVGALRLLRRSQVQVDIVPRLFEVIGPRMQLHMVEGLPLLGSPPTHLSRSSRLAKRVLDLVASAVGLVLLGPLMILIALLIKLDSPGPVFFRQLRMGSEEKPFRIFKFRTMRSDAEELKDGLRHLNVHLQDDPRMFKVADDPRVTPLGRFLRRYALDELPQLLNVLRGEMSLVGPRPLIIEEDDHVREWARTRLHLKPGITGMWQVLGASDIPFDEMTRLDYIYVTNWSMWGDVRLLARTLPALARARRTF
jgi:exopolysaccharide biosynthesis polyprenyl glycosylphosphotransferase